MKKLTCFSLWLCLLVAGGSGCAAQDTVYAHRVLRRLTAPALHGRGPAYGGDSLAALYIRDELRKWKVQPLGKDYFQHFTYNTTALEGPCRLNIDGHEWKPYDDFRVALFSSSFHGLLGERRAVEVPAETLIDEGQLKRFLSKHRGALRDEIVYIDLTRFRPRDAEQAKQMEAARRELTVRNPFGSAVLMLGVDELSTPSPAQADREHDYALVEVRAALMPRRYRDLNLDVSSRFRPNYRTQNVCGMIAGERSDSLMVYTAHYDHLGMMGDSLTFYGAHDNASGVAALLELVRQASEEKPKFTTVFLFFAGEEAGLQGSRYAAAHPLVDFSKVRLLLNIDMFCGGDEGLMIFNATDPSVRPFVDRLTTLNDAMHVFPELRCRENRANSDHYSFAHLCPAMYVLTLGGPYGGYHSPYDKASDCGLQNFVNYLTLLSVLAL